jgi:hypothetical protein
MSTDYDSLAMLAKERHADLLAAAMRRRQQKEQAASRLGQSRSPWRLLRRLFAAHQPPAHALEQPLDSLPART